MCGLLLAVLFATASPATANSTVSPTTNIATSRAASEDNFLYKRDKTNGAVTFWFSVIICLPGLIDLAGADPKKFVIEAQDWAEPCYESNFTRAIRVSATEREWIIEAGHRIYAKRGTLKRIVDQRDGKAILITPEFDKVYGQYLYDSFSDCVSRYSGSIVPQRRRVIGNPTCHMDVQFYGPDFSPYSVAGETCELGWTELYQCNNGAGLTGTATGLMPGMPGAETVVKCKVEIKTGVRDTSDVTRNNVSAVTETIMGKKETTIDKTLTVTDEVEWSLGFELNLDVKIPIMTALNADINGKIRYDYTDTKRKTVTDKVKDELIRTLTSTQTISDEMKSVISKVQTKDNNFDFELESPPGTYQTVVALRMTCNGIDIYPGFIDIRARRCAGCKNESHMLYSAGAAQPVSLDPNQVVNEIGADRRQAVLVAPPVAGPHDDSIVGHAADLLEHLLGYWDSRSHGIRRMQAQQVLPFGAVESPVNTTEKPEELADNSSIPVKPVIVTSTTSNDSPVSTFNHSDISI